MVDSQKESKVNEVVEDSDADDVMLDLQKRENKENILEEHEKNDVNKLANIINQIDVHTDNSDNGNPTKENRIVPSLGSKVTYEDPDRNEWRKAMILSRAGKSSGVNKYWFNIKDLEDGSMKSVDFENINGWKNLFIM